MIDRSSIAEAARLALFGVIVAALVHILTILAAPSFATRDAYARLVPLGPPNATLALERAGPAARLIPYADPAVAAAFCRYDLRGGPLRVRARIVRSGFAALSFHAKTGAVFYALTDKAAVRGELDALLLTEAQLRIVAAKDNEDEPSQDLRIVSPTAEGFVMVAALSEQPSLYPAAQRDAGSLVCTTEPIAK